MDNDVEDRVEQNLMFFDFECTQDDRKHVPNLCVVQNESGDEVVFSGQMMSSANGSSSVKTQTQRSSHIISRPTTGTSFSNTSTNKASHRKL